MYDAILLGGFGIFQSDDANVYLSRSKLAGCNWYLFDEKTNNDFTKEEAENGNLLACFCFDDQYENYLLSMKVAHTQADICLKYDCPYFCSKTDHFEYIRQAAFQKNQYAMQSLAFHYEKGCGCKQDLGKAALYWTLTNNVRKIKERLKVYTIFEESYVYGKWMEDGRKPIYNDYCVNIYEKVHAKAQKAVICWLILSKSLNICKDVRVYIGKLIWKSREEETRVWI
jgi:hypothetical protein